MNKSIANNTFQKKLEGPNMNGEISILYMRIVRIVHKMSTTKLAMFSN